MKWKKDDNLFCRLASGQALVFSPRYNSENRPPNDAHAAKRKLSNQRVSPEPGHTQQSLFGLTASLHLPGFAFRHPRIRGRVLCHCNSTDKPRKLKRSHLWGDFSNYQKKIINVRIKNVRINNLKNLLCFGCFLD